jgi:DNA-binding response OmpR family regulator
MPPKEIELLYYLATNPMRVFNREQLLNQVWGANYKGDTRTVDVHIKRIREKLGKSDKWRLDTVWGVGYKFEIL